jgi:hypothetical protein
VGNGLLVDDVAVPISLPRKTVGHS